MNYLLKAGRPAPLAVYVGILECDWVTYLVVFKEGGMEKSYHRLVQLAFRCILFSIFTPFYFLFCLNYSHF